ncbi:MAG: hypothetical protein IVW36_02360 [Dehalococcoidia bacterium]|nr:hypothetical protein [Dehalococcoidia bacterium]
MIKAMKSVVKFLAFSFVAGVIVTQVGTAQTTSGGGDCGSSCPPPPPPPTPTPNAQQLAQNIGAQAPYSGAVPVEIQTATGQSTWGGVADWASEQLAAAGASAADIHVNLATGETQLIPGPRVTLDAGGGDTPAAQETATPPPADTPTAASDAPTSGETPTP